MLPARKHFPFVCQTLKSLPYSMKSLTIFLCIVTMKYATIYFWFRTTFVSIDTREWLLYCYDWFVSTQRTLLIQIPLGFYIISDAKRISLNIYNRQLKIVCPAFSFHLTSKYTYNSTKILLFCLCANKAAHEVKELPFYCLDMLPNSSYNENKY